MATVISTAENVENILKSINKELKNDSTKDCEYCHSFQASSCPCLVSLEQNIAFVSSRCGAGIYETKALKHASMRSLSCESGSKFTICDNLLNGGTVSVNFRVPDPTARGLSRLYSLGIMSISSSKTSILSSNLTRIIYPRLEFAAQEVIERPEVSPIAADKQKSLTFLHLSMVQLLSTLCHESEEFVKFSIVRKRPLQEERVLNLEQIKVWAKTLTFQQILEDFIRGKKVVVSATDDCTSTLENFLTFVSLPKAKGTLVFENERPQYKVSTSQFEKVEESHEFIPISYTSQIMETLRHETLNNAAMEAKIAILSHKFISIINQWPSQMTPTFIRSKQLSEADVSWCRQYIAGHLC